MKNNINNTLIKGIVLLTILCSTSYANMSKIDISAHVLGGINGLIQEDGDTTNKRRGFDYAANIDFDYQVSDKLSGTIQLQAGPGNGNLGIVGLGAELTDIAITYSPEENKSYTIGSFDTPFGQHIGSLSNNADTFGNHFIVNSLLYDVFAGPMGNDVFAAPMGTLNTLGLMSEYSYEKERIQFAIANGTREDAQNSDGNFSLVLSAQTTRLSDKLSLGLGLMKSNDETDTTAGFRTDFEAAIVDFSYSINMYSGIKGYYSTLDFNDSNSATDDTVTSWMLESYYETEQYVFAVGVSQWLPKDNDGNGTTNDLPNVGFGRQDNVNLSVLTATDQDVTRYQIGITKKLEENVQLKTELLFDDYAKTKNDTVGIMSFVNIAL